MFIDASYRVSVAAGLGMINDQSIVEQIKQPKKYKLNTNQRISLITQKDIIQLVQIMGNTKSEKASNCEQHERLGEVKLVEGTDSEGNIIEEMVVTKMVQSEQQFNRWLKALSKIQDSMTREVLLLPKKSTYQSTGMCGSNGIVYLKYEHYPYVFQMEIENRKNINRYFLETELWYLLYNMIRAGSKFEKYHSKVGDIHPNSILINNDGLVKLISTNSFPGEQTNFDKYMENPYEKVFLAPQELQNSLGRTEYPKNIDPSTAECYSIGLCMLAAGTLQDVDSVYTISGGERTIQRPKVNYYLKLFGERYSSYLHSIVKGLLADNPSNRSKCSQIYASLYEFQDKILDLESFTPSNSRLVSSGHHPFLMTSHQSVPQAYQTKITYGNPQGHNSMHQTNGFMINPIESKYVPVQNTIASHQMHQREGQNYIPPGSLAQGAFRQSRQVQFHRQI